MANKMSEKKKSARQSEIAEPKARTSAKEPQSEKSAKAPAREERTTKPVRRDTKASSAPAKKPGGIRNSTLVRFIRDAYRELRYKVTWPTFVEARNMTLVVIALSTVIGLVLGLVDEGLFQLFRLIANK